MHSILRYLWKLQAGINETIPKGTRDQTSRGGSVSFGVVPEGPVAVIINFARC